MEARRTGSPDLPLHSGPVPTWLADRMSRLGAMIYGYLSGEAYSTGGCRLSGFVNGISWIE